MRPGVLSDAVRCVSGCCRCCRAPASGDAATGLRRVRRCHLPGSRRSNPIGELLRCAFTSMLCDLMKVRSVEAAGFPARHPHPRARTCLAIPNAATPSIRLTRESPSINTVRFSSDLRRCLSPPKPDRVEQPNRLGQSPAAGSGQPPSRHQSFTTAKEAPA